MVSYKRITSLLLLIGLSNLVQGQPINVAKEIYYLEYQREVMTGFVLDFQSYAISFVGNSNNRNEFEICSSLSEYVLSFINNIEFIRYLLYLYQFIQTPTEKARFFDEIKKEILYLIMQNEMTSESINTQLSHTKNNQISYTGNKMKEAIRECNSRLRKLL